MSSKIPSFESEIAITVPLATDVVRYLDMSCFFELAGIPTPATRQATLSRYLHEQFISVEYTGYGITNLGALLFAHDLSVFPKLMPRAFHVIQYAGIDQSHVIKDYSSNLGYAKGFKSMINYILNHFLGTSITELEFSTLVNQLISAIVSQDFSKDQSGPLIEIFADRVEISNFSDGAICKVDIEHNTAIKNPLLFEAIHKLRLNSVEILTNNSMKTHN